MSIKIEITAHPDFGDMAKQVEQSMRALGFSRQPYFGENVARPFDPKWDAAPAYEDTGIDEAIDAQEAEQNTADYQSGDEVQVEQPEAVSDAAPKRERGKPSPGKRKRTAAEIAEDEAAEKQNALIAEYDERNATDGVETAAISTGDERIGPEDDAATAEQDAADEAAEAAANRKDDAPTLDDLRAAMGAYSKKFGMAAATADIPALLGCAPADVPADQIAAAIAKINDVMGRELETAPDPLVATKDDVVKAMLAYVAFADGDAADPTDATTMPNANKDFGELFTLIFGPGITKLSHIPAKPEAWGKTLAGIKEMQEKNPFGRGNG